VLLVFGVHAMLDQPSLDAGLVHRAEPHSRAGKLGIEPPRPEKAADENPLELAFSVGAQSRIAQRLFPQPAEPQRVNLVARSSASVMAACDGETQGDLTTLHASFRCRGTSLASAAFSQCRRPARKVEGVAAGEVFAQVLGAGARGMVERRGQKSSNFLLP
jgi:hypothetical protein